MKTDNKRLPSKPSNELRRRAEDRLKSTSGDSDSSRSAHDTNRLVHELEVHQIELEMQLEELRLTHEDLELSRNNYSELYDFAPVGYFTFDVFGVIQGLNFSGAQLLGCERGELPGQSFSSFIADSTGREVFSDHLELALQRKVTLKCDITLVQKDGSRIYCQLQSIAMADSDGTGSHILTSIVDSTIRKQLGDALQKAHDSLETTVRERTAELNSANMQLTQEVDERRKAEGSLQQAYAEIKGLKDRLQAENMYLQEEIAQQHNFGEIIGQSPALSGVFVRIKQVAPMNATVLLLGETGTGKGVVARAIHSHSVRKGRPLITVNCSSLPANLIESELFGRERGAFTGSDARQIGRFELADGGTIFLDEISEMPIDLQSKLLRVIQDGEFERLGSPRTIKVDVRIIAASNRNLHDEIRDNRFREDLFYRLNVFPITIPPLRQRKEDIPLLVNHFVAKFNKKTGKKIETLSKSTLNALQEYHWPGNVRELESVIERAIITSPGTALQVLDRFDTIRAVDAQDDHNVKALVELEHDHILQVLKKTGWRVEGKNGAALLLGLNASTLRARMRKLGIARQ
jgi:PAS domain S-box-containing protein